MIARGVSRSEFLDLLFGLRYRAAGESIKTLGLKHRAADVMVLLVAEIDRLKGMTLSDKINGKTIEEWRSLWYLVGQQDVYALLDTIETRDALLKRVADDAFSLACSHPNAPSYSAIRARLDETLRLVPGCTFKDSPSDMQLRAEAAERELGKMTELLNQALRATGLLEDRK